MVRFTRKYADHYVLENEFFDNGEKMGVIDVLNCLNDLHEENEKLTQCVMNQSIIIQKMHLKLMEYQLEENKKIILTKEDLKTLDNALSYYTHGRYAERRND